MNRRAFLVAILALGTGFGAVGSAFAADLDTLRARGVIAERYDGYVEVRKGGDGEAKKLVEEVNAKRRALYRKRADNQGVPVEQVGRVYAKQLLDRLPGGTWFRKPDGSYVQK